MIVSLGEKRSFVFGAVRNPLDALVSRTVKYQTDFKGLYSDASSIRKNYADYSDLKKLITFVNPSGAFAPVSMHDGG